MERDRVITGRYLRGISSSYRRERRRVPSRVKSERSAGTSASPSTVALSHATSEDFSFDFFSLPRWPGVCYLHLPSRILALTNQLSDKCSTPIRRKVAGIAMGLILGDESAGETPVILTDILGSEDALGDMDFKVAGDGDGISAFQMDIKVEGITLAVLREALESARVGLVHILGEMDKADPAPAGRMSVYAPQVEVVEVPQKYIGKVIGKGGEQIKAICEQTKIDTIDVNEEGVVTLTGSFGCDMPKAVEIIRSLTVEPEVGKTYGNARVTKVLDFGAFVEILPGVEGLCHVSELDVTRVANVRDVVEEGQTIDVKLLETNERGQFKLSRRAVLLDEGGEKVRRELAEAKVAATSGDDAPGRGRPPPKARRGRSRLRE
ncbi:MAG: hypothetical protein CMJ30_05390 [Phycisphaerae bacterium]|nr:hypothetical protein [Phycisphaerae bacterium]